jgi:hypothetical protein
METTIQDKNDTTKKRRSDKSKAKERERSKRNRQIQKEELGQLKGIKDQWNNLKSQYDLLKEEHDSIINFKGEKKRMEEESGLLKQHNMALEMECGSLRQQNKALETKLQQKEERIMELEPRMVDLMNTIQSIYEETEIKQQVVDNTLDLISQLPPRSPFRRPLLSFFFQGLSQEEAQRIYGVSARTYGRVLEENGSILVEQRYKSNVIRKRITDDQLKEVKEIVNQILPVQSGRDYRVQEATDKKVYELYETLTKGKPVSKSYFFYQILAKEKIHHSKNLKFCPICERYPEDHSEEVLEHVQLFPIQRQAYLEDKQGISSGKDSTTILVTQDFSQLELDGSFVQDLIICKYSYNKNSSDKLDREYRHFIGEVGDKNGINFVVDFGGSKLVQ